jgi:DNA invertase Pin-like site-specific DNA recombinase
MTTIKAAIYLRQSLDKTGEALAISRQREACLKLCAEKGWEAVEYADNDISASTGKPRPAYVQLLADIDSGAVGAVVCWDLDRLHRRPIELEQFIDLADAKHTALATVTGEVDLSTHNGRLYARIKGAVARGEMEQKSERQKLATRQKAEMGKAHSTGRAFGYKTNGTLNTKEANAIRAAYKAMLAGASLYHIAAQWNERGLTSTRGNQWTGRTVRQVLINGRYAGLRFHLGELVTDSSGQPVTTPWPAVVERETWEQTRALLNDSARFTGKSTARKHLLTGLAICGECGHGMGSMSRKSGKGSGYICKTCFSVSRTMAPTDEFVINVIATLLARPDAAVVLAKPRPDVSGLTEEVNRLRARIAQAESDYDEGLIDARRMKAAIERANARLAEVDVKLLSANANRALDGLVGKADARDRFLALSLDRQRKVIDTLAVVTIHKAKRGSRFDHRLIQIDWR